MRKHKEPSVQKKKKGTVGAILKKAKQGDGVAENKKQTASVPSNTNKTNYLQLLPGEGVVELVCS